VKQGGLANFQFALWQDSFVAETTLKKVTLTEDLVVAIPQVDKKDVVVEKAPDGEHYFYIADTPPAPEGPKPESARRVAVLWDASGSRGTTSHGRELDLLAAYLKGHGDREMDVDLVLFRNEPGSVEHFQVDCASPDKLVQRLREVDYDGGTQMGRLLPGRGLKRPAFYLLFTDGLSTFGKEDPGDFDAPVYVFTADARANHSFLRYLALKTGGAYFNLARLEDQAVLARIGRVPFSFIRAKVTAGQAGAFFPRTVQPVQGRFMLAGKLTGDRATIRVEYGVGGRVTHTAEYQVAAKEAVSRSLVRTFWAQKKIDMLSIMPQKNRKELIATGQEFGLVTPGTSLMVLETLEQYVEHRIPPPRSLPDMREEYFETVAQEDRASQRERKHEQEEKIVKVLAMWQERVDWWGREFKYPKNFRFKGEDEEEDGDPAVGSMSGAGMGGAGVRMGSSAPAMLRVASPEPEEREMRREEPKKCKDKAAEAPPPPPPPEITLKEWDPDTPYLKELKNAGRDGYFKVYMAQRRQFGESPAFFLDCAAFFFKKDARKLALQVLSNIAELELENPALLRVLAHRLAQEEMLDLAAEVFEEVLQLRPEEPQSYRDLALVLDRKGQLTRAADLLLQVVLTEWDRFEAIEVIALMELNRVLARARRAGHEVPDVDKRLVKLLDVDVRIILTWDTDMTDMDLWVTEPSGEKAFYSHNRTTVGGLVSRDFTDGYGPEEYLLRRRMPGTYKIEANYFGSSAPTLTGAVTLQVDIFTNYGRRDEERKSITVRLTNEKEEVHIGDVKF